jgi:vacuolar iron transporter family protein
LPAEAPKSLPELQAEHPLPPRARRALAAEAHEQSPVRNYVRDLVLGLNDGIVSVYALVAGVAGAGFAPRQVAVAGVAASIAGAISMGLGEYLSTKSQAQYYAAEAARERQHIRRYPQLERQELRQMLEARGYPPATVEDLVRHLSASEDRFVEFMMREEFGVGEESRRSATLAMLLVTAAFLAGAALPVLPFLLGAGGQGIAWASALSLGALFAAGAAKGRVSGLGWLRSGAEMAALGTVAAAVTYAVGAWFGVAA